jgi:hypothetical protein
VERLCDALERQRNVHETLVVVDADAFYARYVLSHPIQGLQLTRSASASRN